VVVTITQGATSTPAVLKFVSNTQINAILPSTLSVGDADITVTFNGVTGPAVPVKIADASFGVFYSSTNNVTYGIIQNVVSADSYPLNTTGTPARPGQIVVIWGTGLGAINSSDNVSPAGGTLPVSVQVSIGGQSATPSYSGRAPGFAGVDNVYVTLPAGVQTGCAVPVVVTVNGIAANTVNLAVSSDGSACKN
jgi:uncharacterized protein (TIGR03437 family)